MSRITVLIIVVVLIIGALFFLSSQATEMPTSVIETDVSPGTDAR